MPKRSSGKPGRGTQSRVDRAVPASHSGGPGSDLAIEKVDAWALTDKGFVEPNLRIACSLLKSGDANLIFQRLGIKLDPAAPPGRFALPVHVTLTVLPSESIFGTLAEQNLHLACAYLREAERNPALRTLTGRLAIPMKGAIDIATLQQNLRALHGSKLVADLRLATPLLPNDVGAPRETHPDFGLPADRTLTIDGTSYIADGRGTIIGIIDDGCSLAHWNFIREGPASRVVFLWDQGRSTGGGDWQPVDLEPQLGYELINAAELGDTPINDALEDNQKADGVIDEDGVYGQLGYWPYSTLEGRTFIAAPHGTHVMDIAAGNGRALFGNVGVAPAAEIIFVQLPAELIAEGGVALTRCVLLGAQYIFDRAARLAQARGARIPVSINISYGGYAGSHDGVMPAEAAFDQLLAVHDRAIVIAAGNGYAAGCHARGTVTHARERTLRWQVPPFDESYNRVEIWYTGPAQINLYIKPPGRGELGPIEPKGPYDIVDANGDAVGHVDHVPDPKGNRSLIQIDLNPTWNAPAAGTQTVTAPAGTWRLRLTHKIAGKRNRFHAWIERDEARGGTRMRRVQSRFHDDDCDPRFTTTGIATGLATIAVGGYGVATREVAEYSACGPTRPYPDAPAPRVKPEVCAPAAFDATGTGVASANARFALQTRMGGTSVAAPHVAGLAALVQQINMELGNAPLSVDDLRRLIVGGASGTATSGTVAALIPNRHQAADPNQPVKQKGMLHDLVGAGTANAWATLSLLG